jgi:TIR domain
MSIGAAFGFWSYTHEDDTLDGGNILQFSRLLMEEYNLLSGEPLNLFVDRNDIAWGEAWRTRIDSSLIETIFFIPIITPRYFTRPECRRELLEFAAKAKMLGTQELLLPVLYIETKGLSTESPDEAVKLVAETQYADWRKNRLIEPSSREYRAAVSALAQRLLNIARNVAEAQLEHELNSDLEGDDGFLGIADIVTRIEALLPDWLDAVIVDKSVTAQTTAVWQHHQDQVSKLRKRKAQPSALLSTQIRTAREMLPLAERAQRDSEIYLARSIELDPLISKLALLVAENPESFSLVAPVREAIDEAMEAIRDHNRTTWDNSVQKELKNMDHLGRVFRQSNIAFALKIQNVTQGNEIVKRWNMELVDHNSRETEKLSSEEESEPENINAEEIDRK